MNPIPGISREEEEAFLREIQTIAQEKMEINRRQVKDLEEQLHAMQEDFNESDKEMQTLWHDTDARFKFVNLNLKRALQAKKKPYFGRIDLEDKKTGREDAYYIGRHAMSRDPADPQVIDWRAPIAGVYYDAQPGEASYSVEGQGEYRIRLFRKRTYEIENDALKDFYDSDVVANDELLTKYLAKNKKAVLGEIIATIQKEQNEVIRMNPRHNLIIQGAAGSGKTTVAMHRISYILYNYELEFAPEDFYIIGSNKVLLDYITGVLPQLDVYGVRQMTMEELFVRLLYEDWDRKYKVLPVQAGITPKIKGTLSWFQALEEFCQTVEDGLIPMDDVRMEKNNVLLMPRVRIEQILAQSKSLSRADKITRLTEHLIAKLENEICGKYASYSKSEKERLTRYYSTYFGKREYKGSIFSLYQEFLEKQREKGHEVTCREGEFDVYDLAALAYLYKRIKEDEIIREAGHVVIDEAQDFGMMVYACLKYCLSKCTYTVMGDVSQNIYSEYGLNDWKELRKLLLPGDYDYFGLLRKSYRNTIEIAEFATNILCHGTFPIYPIEPIIRHGKPVRTEGFQTKDAMDDAAGKILTDWLEQGMETIAVICPDEEDAGALMKRLEGRVPVHTFDGENTRFQEGVMVLTLEYTKGLEFDAVLLYNVSEEKYPWSDGAVKRLYVAATRALHELAAVYEGSLTRLIAEPVSQDKLKKAAVKASAPKKPRFEMPKDTRTLEEKYRDQALLGEREMQERHMYGPKRIDATGLVRKERGNAGAGQGAALAAASYKEQVLRELQEKTGSERECRSRPKVKTEFGDMPSGACLQVPGHAMTDCGVRIVRKDKAWFEFTSNAGVLRITPVACDTVRICFTKELGADIPPVQESLKGTVGGARTRENSAMFELFLERLTVHLDKRTGAMKFFDAKGKPLLAEREKEPRFVLQNRGWQFFDWKKEAFVAKGLDALRDVLVDKTARYISYGQAFDLCPGLSSAKGYELAFPPKTKILLCTIPTYGNYIAFEETALIDYYVRCK